MSFWQWFVSDERVTEALAQSSDYDISPVVIVPPAVNSNVPPVVEAKKAVGLTLDLDYTPPPRDDSDYWDANHNTVR